MLLTIHGVEKLQTRTGLLLSELKKIFKKKAYINIGRAYDLDYFLFYDYRANNHLVALVHFKTKELISIWYSYFDFPCTIAKEINSKNKSKAKSLVYQRQLSLKTANKYESGNFTVEICVKNEYRSVINKEKFCTVSAQNYQTARRDELLYYFAPEILRLASITLQNSKDLSVIKTKVYIYAPDNKIFFNFAYKKNEILLAYGELSAKLVVSEGAEDFSVNLGPIDPDNAKRENDILEHFKSRLRTVRKALAKEMETGRLEKVRYTIQVDNSEYGYVLHKFRRNHIDLTNFLNKLTV